MNIGDKVSTHWLKEGVLHKLYSTKSGVKKAVIKYGDGKYDEIVVLESELISGIGDSFYVFSNKEGKKVSDFFSNENDAKKYMYDLYEKTKDFSLSVRRGNKYAKGSTVKGGEKATKIEIKIDEEGRKIATRTLVKSNSKGQRANKDAIEKVTYELTVGLHEGRKRGWFEIYATDEEGEEYFYSEGGLWIEGGKITDYDGVYELSEKLKPLMSALNLNSVEVYEDGGSILGNGGALEGWGGTSESSQDGMLIGGTNAELTSNQYGKGGGVKRTKTAEEIYEEEQQNAMFNSEYAKGGVIPYALRKRVENVKKKFGIEITKEMGLQAYHWNTEEGMGGSSVGLKLYKAKNKRDSQTIGDTAIDLGKYYSEYGNGGMTSGWCYSIGGL